MKFNDLIQEKYILIDFNCAHESTHHWSSMVLYGSFIEKKGANFEFWVPRYISKDIKRKLTSVGKVSNFLSSPQYGATNLMRFPVAYLISKVAKFHNIKSPNTSLIGNLIKRAITIYCLGPALMRIAKESRKSTIFIVFPTLDYLGIQLIKLVEKKFSGISIHVRRMGSETRSPFSNGTELVTFIELIESASNNTIRMGIPTLGLLDKIKEECSRPNQIYWSPLPPNLVTRDSSKKREEAVNIGFPGTAKLSKGYSKIPTIIDRLSKEGIKANIFLQKALYPWDGYLETRDKILSSDLEIHELNSVISISEYHSLLSNLDLIILPYERDSYLNADSGILYEAADYGIPILCEEKLGFSDEAFLNGIGFNINQAGTMKNLVMEAISEQTQANIITYNKQRDQAMSKFLFEA